MGAEIQCISAAVWSKNKAVITAERHLARGEKGACSALWLAAGLLTVNSVFGPTNAAAQTAAAEAAPGEPRAATLTNVQQVLSLGIYRARTVSQPVLLRGTLVQVSREAEYVFVHDGSACILAVTTNPPAGLAAGKIVEIAGWTEAGLRAPMVDRAEVRVLGEGPLPPAAYLPVARMKAGEGCWQWVRIEGVVRDMNRDVPNLALSIAAENRRFSAFVFGYERFNPHGLPLHWLEARVVMDAICWIDVNDRSEPIDFHVTMMHTNQIQFLRPGTTNVFAEGAVPAANAVQLHQPSDDRLKLTGTVLAVFPDDRFFLRTEFGPLQARLSAPITRGMPKTEFVPRPPAEPLAPGDQVQLVGAPAESRFAPLLVDAEYRRTGNEPPPAAIVASRRNLISGQHDADLVRVVGRLLTQQRRQAGIGPEETLVLGFGDTVFEASFLRNSTNALPNLRLNSRVEVSGICQVQPGPGDLRRNFKVLLRSPEDVRYLGQVPLWSQPGMSRILGLGSAFAVAGGLWVLLLRRQVSQRTSQLAAANRNLLHEVEEREKAQADLRRALAAERELSELKSRFVSLVSHEFRTPLGITMSAVELLRNYLDRLPQQKLKELLDDIYSSTLRMSGLMEQVLLLGRVEAGKVAARRAPINVAAIAAKLVDETLSATHRKCPIQLIVKPSLEAVESDESLLRHIFSNLLSNAVKYSPEARPVQFIVERNGHDLVFIVHDYGIGIPEADRPHLFEPFHRASNVGQTQGTGLGLLIVKRCVELLDGKITFESREGAGTTFTVRLPL